MTDVLDTQNDPNQRAIFDDVGSAADALLARWDDAGEDQPSENEEEEATELTEEASQSEQEIEIEEDDEADAEDETDFAEDEQEDDTQDEEQEVTEIDDDTMLEIQVDGDVQQISVKQLKRLAGQEASLTRKSQEVAEKRKEAEEQVTKTDAVLRKMVESAEARWKPYEEVDMLVASRTMDANDFAQLRKEAQEAYNDYKFLTEEADAFYQDLQNQRQQQLQQAAREAIKVLERDIPEWDSNLYNDIRTYAIQQGLPEEDVNSYVDPVVLKVLHKARLFDQAKQVTTTKKKRVAKKVLKSKKAPATEANLKAKRQADAKAKLRERGNDLDDIADVLLTRWEA